MLTTLLPQKYHGSFLCGLCGCDKKIFIKEVALKAEICDLI